MIELGDEATEIPKWQQLYSLVLYVWGAGRRDLGLIIGRACELGATRQMLQDAQAVLRAFTRV